MVPGLSAPSSGGFGGGELFSASIKDDVTAVAAKMANSLGDLHRDVAQLGSAFKKANTGNLNIGLKESRKLFQEAGGNAKLFKAALRDAGTSALDTKVLLARMNAELLITRKNALGMNGIFAKAFNIHPHTLETLGKMRGIIGGIVGGLAKVGLGAGLAGLGAAALVGNEAKGLIESVVDAAKTRENALLGMKHTLMQSKEGRAGLSESHAEKKAEEEYDWMRREARKTAFPTAKVQEIGEREAIAGYSEEEMKLVTKTILDIGTKYRFQPQKMDAATALFENLRMMPTVSLGLFTKQMRVAGIDPGEVAEDLLRMPKFKKFADALPKGATREQRWMMARKMISGGNVGGMDVGQAIFNSNARINGAAEGEFAEKVGPNMLEGAITNAQSAWSDLIKSVNSAKWEGITQLRFFLNRISTAFDETTVTGKHTLSVIQEATDNLLGGLKDITQQDIDLFIRKAGQAAKDLSVWIREAWDWFSKLLHSDMSFADTMKTALTDVGTWIGKGLWKGARMGMAEDFGVGKEAEATVPIVGGKPNKEGLVDTAFYDSGPANLRDMDIFAEIAEKMRDLPSERAGFKEGKMMQTVAIEDLLPPGRSAITIDEGMGGAIAAGAIGDIMGVPQFASGGLVTSPTLAMVGEAGPEMIIPLSARGMSNGPVNFGRASGWGGSGGGSRSFDVDVNINMGGGSGGDAAAQWQAIRPVIVREVKDLFSRVAMEG